MKNLKSSSKFYFGVKTAHKFFSLGPEIVQDRSLFENRDSSTSELAPRLVQNNIFFYGE